MDSRRRVRLRECDSHNKNKKMLAGETMTLSYTIQKSVMLIREICHLPGKCKLNQVIRDSPFQTVTIVIHRD